MARKRLGSVIAVGNQKGGVGKTTNTVHIAAALGEHGYKCVIIDLDPAAGSTNHLGVNPTAYGGTFELLVSQDSPQDLAIEDGMPKNVHLIPARFELSELDKHLNKFDSRTTLLDRGLEEARPDYDFILLDTAPFANAPTTVAAYSVADWFLLSAFPHILSVKGLNQALSDIADVRARQNSKLEILGLVFCCVDRRTKARHETEAFVKQYLPERAFSVPYIPTSVILNKAAEKGKTLFQIKRFRTHPIADDYRALARDIAHRVKNRDAFLAGTLGPSEAPKAAADGPAVEVLSQAEKRVVDVEKPVVTNEQSALAKVGNE